MKHKARPSAAQMGPKRIFLFLWQSIKNEKKLFAQTVVLTLLLTGLGLVTPKVLSVAIDWIPRLCADKTIGELALLLLAGLGLYLMQCALAYLEDVKSSALFLRIASYMRNTYFKKITSTTMAYLDSGRHGDFISRGTNDLETVVKLLSETLLKIISCATLFVGCMVIMLCASWQLAMIAIASTIATFLATFILGGFIKKHASRQQVLLGNINSYLEDCLNVLKSIKLYNREKYVAGKFAEQSTKLKKESVATLGWISVVAPINNFIGNLNFLCIAIFGSVMALSGNSGITIATIVLFVLYIREFTETINDLSEIVSETQVAMKAAERYIEVLNAAEEISGDTDRMVANGDIVLDNVHFGYIQDKEVLSGVSLWVKSGQSVAIAGASGCGKTTLVQLLLRLYEADAGSIHIGGADIRNLSLSELRRNVIAVMQDDFVFDESLSYNIGFQTDEEALIQEMKLDDHLDVEILSRGQMQKICVLRAFSAKAKVIILDESMSLVDQLTYQKMFTKLRELFPEATFVTITHQLSFLQMCDQIFFVANGKISEQGTFEQLVDKKGAFYEMLSKEK